MTSILSISADRNFQESLARAFASQGIEAAFETDPGKGLERFRGEFYDLVISDWEINGEPLVRRFRKIRPATPVIVMSENRSGEAVAEALRLRVYDYLFKPCEVETVLGKVVAALTAWESLSVASRDRLLAMCAQCKKVCDDDGQEPWSGPWIGLDSFLTRITGKNVSHGHCPECDEQANRDMQKILDNRRR